MESVEVLRQRWELSNSLLQSLARKLHAYEQVHESGRINSIELDDIKTEYLKQESETMTAWKRVVRQEKVFAHWQEIAGDYLEGTGPASEKSKVNKVP